MQRDTMYLEIEKVTGALPSAPFAFWGERAKWLRSPGTTTEQNLQRALGALFVFRRIFQVHEACR
jgi:hypothetical protein